MHVACSDELREARCSGPMRCVTGEGGEKVLFPNARRAPACFLLVYAAEKRDASITDWIAGYGCMRACVGGMGWLYTLLLYFLTSYVCLAYLIQSGSYPPYSTQSDSTGTIAFVYRYQMPSESK
jgi:hypothetical protein